MTREETKAILKILKIAYPHSFIKMTKNDAEIMVDLWTYQFSGNEYQEVMSAVQNHISESAYLPSIQNIKEKLTVPQIEYEDMWHKRFGYSDEPIYYDDDFLDTVVWADVPKDIRDRMMYHCNPKDYAKYNATVEIVRKYNQNVKTYDESDTAFLRGKMTTWKYEVLRS